jgi:anti-sigma factor RsiW
MSGCNFHPRLEAFFDGEMNAADHAKFQQHLPGCAECTAALAGMERMSQFFAGMRDDVAEQPQAGEIARLHQAVDREMNRSLFQADRSFWRTAGLIGGLAASVLIVASAWLSETPGRQPGFVPGVPAMQAPWEEVATSLQVDPLPNAGADVNPDQSAVAEADAKMTDWMLNGLKGTEGR